MILLRTENRVTTLTLNRPEKRNALNDEMASLLYAKLVELKDDDSCKVLVIEGSGDAFCAGADLDYLSKLQMNSYEENLADSINLMKMFRELYLFPKLTISKVNGPAFAGGCGLAGICDFCFAGPDARFSYTELRIGFIPAIVSVFLASRIGENAARRMLLAAEVYSASEALGIGLVSELCEADQLDSKVMNFASTLVSSVSAESVASTKKLLAGMQGLKLDEKLLLAAEANAAARGSEDCKKGISAFLNKEKINW